MHKFNLSAIAAAITLAFCSGAFAGMAALQVGNITEGASTTGGAGGDAGLAAGSSPPPPQAASASDKPAAASHRAV